MAINDCFAQMCRDAPSLLQLFYFVHSSLIWAALFAYGGYAFGTLAFEVEGALRPILFAVATMVFFGGGFLMRHFEEQLQVKAEQALPPRARIAGPRRICSG